MQTLLEKILDALCKATKRDIFVVLPTKEKDKVPYLIKEIKQTLDRIKWALCLFGTVNRAWIKDLQNLAHESGLDLSSVQHRKDFNCVV